MATPRAIVYDRAQCVGRPERRIVIASAAVVVSRWLYLAASLGLVGGASLILLAGFTDRPTALAWQARVTRVLCGLAVLALLAGVAVLAEQAAVLEDRPAAAFELGAVARVALQTQAGGLWLVRQSFIVVLTAFVVLHGRLSRRSDWRAARAESLALATLALACGAAAGHAAAVEPGTAAAVTVDMAHLVAGGLWIGGLPGLALLLAAAARPAGADARPYAVLAARRFSSIALPLMIVLLLTGALNSIVHVGTIGSLLGTRYGRLLLLKLALVVVVLGLATANRRRVLPALAGDADRVGRPAMRRLARLLVAETALALALVAVVALMTMSPPAVHEPPVWPLPFRLAWASASDDPQARALVLVGAALASLGLSTALAALLLGRWRLPVLSGGVVLVAAGLGLALPPLAADAYPTTYQRPTVPYQAGVIADGATLFAVHCAPCHGPTGAGDGPAGAGLSPPPANLRAHHAAVHTAGDLYWWITHGRRRMPAFGARLDEEQRWKLVNYIRALAAGAEARALTARVAPGGPRLVAPDFTFAVGPTPARALRDYRGRRSVLVVAYTLPSSRQRLAMLATRYDQLAAGGLEVIAVPTDGDPDAIARLGADPRILFPVVTDGATEILVAYRLFADGGHVEYLVDRQGYLRAIDAAAADPAMLLANVETLRREKVTAPPAGIHAH